MNQKPLLVDVVGYATLVPLFMLYNHLERTYDGYVAVIVAVVAFLPVAAVWHFYYAKYSDRH